LELEGNYYTWERLAFEVEANVLGQTMIRILKAALNPVWNIRCVTTILRWMMLIDAMNASTSSEEEDSGGKTTFSNTIPPAP
jgi:nicotinamide riboside transporter PnuC